MNKRNFNINEEEKNRIKNLYLLNEQDTLNLNRNIRVARPGGEGTQGKRGGINYEWVDVMKDMTVPGNMFILGSDKIDTDSTEFKQAAEKVLTILKNVKDKVKVTFQGGASKVGSASGYNNLALANRRRDNFIKALNNYLGDYSENLDVIKLDGIVGQATKPNSKEANEEQFVKITYPDKEKIMRASYTTDIESTDVSKGPIGGGMKKITPLPNPDKEGNPYMIIKLYYKKGEKDSYKMKILNATGSPARELLDYKAAKNCGLKFE